MSEFKYKDFPLSHTMVNVIALKFRCGQRLKKIFKTLNHKLLNSISLSVE